MHKINENRRLILKGVGALGTSSILIVCGGGSSSSSSSGGSSSTGGASSKGTSAAVCAGSSSTIPLVIDASVSATGIPASVTMYAYIVGLTAAGEDTYYRYNAATGQKKPVTMNPTADNTNAAGTCAGMTTGGVSALTNYHTVWADYSIPLDRSCATLVADLASFNGTNLPGLGTGTNAFSGRIYISVGQPLLPFTPRKSNQRFSSNRLYSPRHSFRNSWLPMPGWNFHSTAIKRSTSTLLK